MQKDQIRIGTPCTVDWRTMTPAQGGRFCGDCKKVVHNLSAMSEEEARALLAEGRPDLCARFIYDAEGRVFFARAAAREAARENLVPASLLNRAKRVAAAAATVALPFGGAACASHDPTPGAPEPAEHYELAGGVSPNDVGFPNAVAPDAGDAGANNDAGHADGGPKIDEGSHKDGGQ